MKSTTLWTYHSRPVLKAMVKSATVLSSRSLCWCQWSVECRFKVEGQETDFWRAGAMKSCSTASMIYRGSNSALEWRAKDIVVVCGEVRN